MLSRGWRAVTLDCATEFEMNERFHAVFVSVVCRCMNALDAHVSIPFRFTFVRTVVSMPSMAFSSWIRHSARLHNECREAISAIDFTAAKSHKNVTNTHTHTFAVTCGRRHDTQLVAALRAPRNHRTYLLQHEWCDVSTAHSFWWVFNMGAKEFSVAPHSDLNNLIIITIIAINIIDVKYPSDLQFAVCIVRKIQFSRQKKKREKNCTWFVDTVTRLPHHNRSKPADSVNIKCSTQVFTRAQTRSHSHRRSDDCFDFVNIIIVRRRLFFLRWKRFRHQFVSKIERISIIHVHVPGCLQLRS